MSEPERDRFVSTALVRTGYLRGTSDRMTPELSDAIGRYQADSDLVPNGRVDFDIYYRLLASDPHDAKAVRAAAAVPVAAVTPAVPPAVAATSVPPEPPRLALNTARGPRPSYHAGETMVVSVQPTQDAYVYCYYQDAGGTIARIFPNRFQPDPFLRARTQIEIPPASGKSFAIRFDKPGSSESVACLGSDREVGLRLPAQLKAQDLEPLPVKGLDDVAAQFRNMPGAHVDDARLTVEVLR